MQIVIAGGTGFLGFPLTAALIGDGHRIAVLSRSATPKVPTGATPVQWNADTAGKWSAWIDEADVVINLTGESIAARRWTAAQKARIEESRLSATRALVAAIRSVRKPPALFLSGSAVGFYGACGDEVVTEETGAGHDFLAAVCRRWEGAAADASSSATRVVCLRTGLVLESDGGALQPLLRPFKLGVGGRLGSGRQYWPWIHRRDWIDLVRFIIATPSIVGAINATAPNPVTNQTFTRELGRVLNRPTLFPVPALALRILLGEMAGPLILSGQRAVPAKAQQFGFSFTFPDLGKALENMLLGKR
jgi:uncharacterized protein (TIGR01777 family)